MISVIIPAWNAARFLEETLGSVRAQGDIPREIVVVDDGSTDDTAGVAASLGTDVRVLRQTNKGPAAARNAGVLATSGEFIACLDADDLWPPGRIALLLSRLDADPAQLIAIGRTQLIAPLAEGLRSPHGTTHPRGIAESYVESGTPWHAPAFGSALIRRDAFRVVGEIDPTLRLAEDLDWFIRARERAVPTVVVPDTVLHYRIHGANLTRGADAAQRNMMLALKRSLDRRRDGAKASVALLGDSLPDARGRHAP